jgi:sugar/nucleoside kinase (ribokinase family)
MTESRRVVCLGEALVDFVCEKPVASLGEADAFVPRPGGSLANIAVCAARFGAAAEMLGGAGDDEWGAWLRDGLQAEGVGVERFVLMPGAGTSHAFVSVDDAREPSFEFYGDSERPAAHAADDLDPALAGAPGVLVVGSDTVIGADERAVTMRAAEMGRERGWTVLCDPNVRPRRWDDEDEMLRVIRELVSHSDVVKLNESEAAALAGDRPSRGSIERSEGRSSAEAAGRALCELGPEAVVVTRGERGAIVVADGRVDSVDAVRAEVVDSTGAGDSVAGVAAAGLALGAEPGAIAPVIHVAMGAAAAVVATWGATQGLPPAGDAREQLEAALAR